MSSMPWPSRNSARWKPSGSFWRIVCSITRGPAKPISAPGSATFRSPSIANEAVTPPVVGSVSTLRNGRRASSRRASERRVPLLTISATGGARQHEGVLSLMQMAKVNMALTRLAAVGQPHIALLADPCYAGIIASYASVADIIIAEPGARIGFAGQRVIEQTIRQKLPDNFQTAEFMLEHGMIDMVVPRSELRAMLARLLRLYAADGRSDALATNLAMMVNA